MATKRIVKDEVVETPVMEDQLNTDPWDTMVEIMIPRHRHGEEEYKFVSVNDIRALVHLDGKVHKLPLPIAEAMTQYLAGEDKVEEYKDTIPNETTLNGIPVL